MKIISFLVLFILSLSVFAQEKHDVTGIFVRVYNLQGKKIDKGKIYAITDSLLHLSRRREIVKIPVKTIGLIRTKRSAGYNVLIGTAIGAPLMTAVVIAQDNPYLPYPIGTFFGTTLGAAIGAITILFKDPITFEINGSESKLKGFEETMVRLKQTKINSKGTYW